MKLLFFTESFPYGLGESWKYNEIVYLSKLFDEIVVIPMWYSNNTNPLTFQEKNVEVLSPVLPYYMPKLEFGDIRLVFSIKFLKEIYRSGSWLNKEKIIKALLFFKRARILIKSERFRKLLSKSDSKTIWYFYWGRGWADILPFLDNRVKARKVVRFHGFDLYKERNNGYIPFRNQLLSNIDLSLLISENGRRYLIKEYGVPSEKAKLCRIGTTHYGISRHSEDGKLYVLSCSGMVPVKRIDRIVNTLKKIYKIPIHWTHIGDGPMFNQIKNMAKELPDNIFIHLTGKLAPREVSRYFLSNPVDLFINVSDSEGVPVSIMEAFSFGIPVIATNVGGTSEIVDKEVGSLININENVEDSLRKEIENFINLSVSERERLRENALKRFHERCDALKLSKELGDILISNTDDCNP